MSVNTQRPRASRRRLLVRWILVLAALAVALALAIGAVVLGLRSLEPAAQVSPECVAGEYRVAPDQAANAALIVGTTVRRGLPARAGTIGIATALQESWMRNIDYGDRDSLGMFQQRPSQGWGTPEQVMDPVYAVNIFYDHLVAVPGYTEMAVTEAAQAVQRSGFPDAYAQHEELARAFASALTGWTEADLRCVLDPFDGDPAAVAPAVVTRLERDYGVVGTVTTLSTASTPSSGSRGAGDAARAEAGWADVAILDARSLGRPDEDTTRLAWAIAQGAVAGAVDTGAGTVRVAASVWERETGRWRAAGENEAVPELGMVVVAP